MGSNPSILVLDDSPTDYFEKLSKQFPECRIALCTEGSEAESVAIAMQPEIILSFKSKRITTAQKRRVMLLPCVEWIHVCGSGYDHIEPVADINAVITNSAGVLSAYLGETILGILLMMSFGFPQYFHQQQSRHWQPIPRESVIGKTVLIVGLGNVGREVAKRCKQSGMNTLGVRTTAKATEYVDEVADSGALPAMLPRADYVCLHVPLNEHTRDSFGERQFAAMRSGSYFLNASRGGVVDEQALVKALGDGTLRAAYSDVFAEEPLPKDSPLWTVENLIISPHYADSVDNWQQHYVDFFAANLNRWADGKQLQNIVKTC